VTLPHQTFRELGAGAVMELLLGGVGLPLVVKPTRGGSALGTSVVGDPADLPQAMVTAYAYGDTALVERFVAGGEVAVPVLDLGDGPVALPAVGIRPDGGFYDYTARYTAGSTEFSVPAALDDAVAEECARVAVAAHQALGLRHLSRSDLVVDEAGDVHFLEVNVAPGMTETSLVPLSLEAAGLDLGRVVADLVAVASAVAVPRPAGALG
jgi:D-alanine-D-alanine ligase